MYSDPGDDGIATVENGFFPSAFFIADVSRTFPLLLKPTFSYPEGPARNPTSLERGSVQFLSLYPGDPTTPGYPSYENSTRSRGINRPSIPSLPISWNNALILLQWVCPNDGNHSIHILNHGITLHLFAPFYTYARYTVKDRVTPIWNVMGVIPGSNKDEVLMIGSHRDGVYLKVHSRHG